MPVLRKGAGSGGRALAFGAKGDIRRPRGRDTTSSLGIRAFASVNSHPPSRIGRAVPRYGNGVGENLLN